MKTTTQSQKYFGNLPLQRLILDLTTVGFWHGCSLNLSRPPATTLEVPTAIQPGRFNGAFGLEVTNLAFHLQRQANVIEAVDEAVLPEGVDVESRELGA